MSSGGKLAIGGVGGVIVLIIGLLMGGDPEALLQQLQGTGVQQSGVPAQISAEEQELTELVEVVFASTEDVWSSVFASMSGRYQPSTLVFYRDQTPTDGCGMGASAYGPFYCPADQKVYIDLSFNDELHERFGATGDFAMAYVVAHEVGHHVQNLLGTMEKTNRLRAELSEREYNKVSVMVELQADFYAGVWAHHANRASEIRLELADVLEGMRAAEAVGDDRIQQQAQGRVVPEAFTHGTAAQRAHWFRKGYDTGDMRQGDTFSDPSLQ